MSARRRHAGATLLEALVAFAVLSIGLLGVARLHAVVQHGLGLDAERTEAWRLARRDLEALRAPGSALLAPGAASASQTLDVRPGPGGPRLRLVREQFAGEPLGALAWASVTVASADRPHAWAPVALHSALAQTDAALSGALVLPRGPGLQAHGRAPGVPPAARDLGDGRSVLQPAAALPLVFVFDNLTGRITARCEDASLADCTAVDALALGGWVRFSFAAPPDAGAPADAPLPLGVVVHLARGSVVPPGCLAEQRDGAVAYHCAIEPAEGAWSGRSDLAPRGWALGLQADAYRVCRYVATAAGGTAHERNAAHPERYEHVDRSLMQQNFLVIRGDQACPVQGASAAHPDGLATAPHQP